MAMLNQVLYPIPKPMKGFVAQVFVSIVDWDSKFTTPNFATSTDYCLQSFTFAVSSYAPVGFEVGC